MKDDEYLNKLTYGKPTGTITIMPHPEDIIDVDPVIIAKMKARLKGENFNHVYDITDRVIDEITIQREKNKLKRIFGSEIQVKEAFSSIRNVHLIQEEFAFEDVDKKLLADYAFIMSRESNVDEVDFYRSFLFDTELVDKQQRVSCYSREFNPDARIIFILNDYRNNHFDRLAINKEIIQLNQSIKELFVQRTLVSFFDVFLKNFYGIKI